MLKEKTVKYSFAYYFLNLSRFKITTFKQLTTRTIRKAIRRVMHPPMRIRRRADPLPVSTRRTPPCQG